LGTGKKIGFLKLGDSGCASTRVRVDYVLPYMDNAVASRNVDDLTDCDVVIFQKRYKSIDIVFAQWLKAQGKKIIFDLPDPVWDKNYPEAYFPITGDSEEDFTVLLKMSDWVTFNTDRLRKMFNDRFLGHRTLVIKDRIDLALHTGIKEHKEKPSYIILWYGNRFNTKFINLIRDDLEKLYKDIDFKLIIINDPRADRIEPFTFETEYRIWKLETINDEILKVDITVNPHPKNSYKSNNKTIKSLALGVPCVDINFYHNCRKLLSDIEVRKQIAREGRQLVEQKYNSQISAKEIERLVWTS